MEKIAELKSRIRLAEKLFDDHVFKGYEDFEKHLLVSYDYKKYFFARWVINPDILEKYYQNALSGEDIGLYQAISYTPAAIRFQYEQDKKELEELENGNN